LTEQGATTTVCRIGPHKFINSSLILFFRFGADGSLLRGVI